MRGTREQAAGNRERIVEAAARLFRTQGFDGVGVDAIMKAAGLTHGGFYGHFGSKSDLVAEAVTSGLAENAKKQKSQSSVEELVARYLSPEHRLDIATGCLISAVGGELPRQTDKVRAPVTAYVSGQISRIADLVSARSAEARRKRAIATLSGLVGALILARAVGDPALSDEILDSARACLGETLDEK